MHELFNVKEIFGIPISDFTGKVLYLAIAVGLGIFFQKLLVKLVHRWMQDQDIPHATIFVNLVRTLVWVFVALVVLDPVFGIAPTALITGLGIASLIVSFGLQDTVKNIISGIGLTTTKVVVPGDYISVNNVTGLVTDVTWRHTVVKDRKGNIEIVPNAVLSTSPVSRLTPQLACQCHLHIDVKPDCDLEKVEKHLTEVTATALGDYLVTEYPTFIRCIEVTSSHTKLEVFFHIKEDIRFKQAKDLVVRKIVGDDYLA